jgi:ABC-2 type transport system ATP-binding protein
MPAVEQVAAFGTALHVTGSNREELRAALAPLLHDAGHEWREVDPGLEDVFIHLMRDADDPSGGDVVAATASPRSAAK